MLFCLGCRSTAGGEDPSSPGTSKLALTAFLVGASAIMGELVCIGNLVVGGSMDLSLRWLRPLACGAGLLFRDFETIALLRASVFARRLLSSVLMALMREALEALPPLGVCDNVEARFNSPKISSLWANRSRINR